MNDCLQGPTLHATPLTTCHRYPEGQLEICFLRSAEDGIGFSGVKHDLWVTGALWTHRHGTLSASLKFIDKKKTFFNVYS